MPVNQSLSVEKWPGLRPIFPFWSEWVLTDLSMNPPALLEAKKVIRDMAFQTWQSVARTACDLASLEEINRLIEHERTMTASLAAP